MTERERTTTPAPVAAHRPHLPPQPSSRSLRTRSTSSLERSSFVCPSPPSAAAAASAPRLRTSNRSAATRSSSRTTSRGSSASKRASANTRRRAVAEYDTSPGAALGSADDVEGGGKIELSRTRCRIVGCSLGGTRACIGSISDGRRWSADGRADGSNLSCRGRRRVDRGQLESLRHTRSRKEGRAGRTAAQMPSSHRAFAVARVSRSAAATRSASRSRSRPTTTAAASAMTWATAGSSGGGRRSSASTAACRCSWRAAGTAAADSRAAAGAAPAAAWLDDPAEDEMGSLDASAPGKDEIHLDMVMEGRWGARQTRLRSA